MSDDEPAFETLAVHAGAEPDELTGAVSPPIYQTSTYAQDGVGKPRGGYEYARSQNPTRERLERAVAALEGGRTGSPSPRARRRPPRSPSWPGRARRSSSATTSTAGRTAISSASIAARGSTRVRRPGRRAGRPVGGADRTDAARLVRDADQPAAQDRRHRGDRRDGRAAGGEGGRRPLVVVDNTFASPALQRPLTLGADIVFHSATKYLAGHSDTILGVAATSDDAVAERLRFLQNAMGAVPGPLDCFLVLRGLRTLHLRMERHAANAGAIGALLEAREDVADRQLPGVRVAWSRSCPRGGRTGRRPPSARPRSRRRRACSPWPSRSAASNRSSRSRRR